jgi:hypothetical protein
MPADPIDPGAMPIASIQLTASQTEQLAEFMDEHPGPVRLEKLIDGYARVVLIGADGDPAADRPLFPT